MHAADKSGAEKAFQADAKTGYDLTRHLGYPSLNNTAIHLGGCFFAATMIGAAVTGIWGAVVGACVGLIIGALAKDR